MSGWIVQSFESGIIFFFKGEREENEIDNCIYLREVLRHLHAVKIDIKLSQKKLGSHEFTCGVLLLTHTSGDASLLTFSCAEYWDWWLVVLISQKKQHKTVHHVQWSHSWGGTRSLFLIFVLHSVTKSSCSCFDARSSWSNAYIVFDLAWSHAYLNYIMLI